MSKIFVGLELNSTLALLPMLSHLFFNTTGKDQIIFVTREDHENPSSAELIEEDPDDPYEERGVEQ